VNVSQDTAAAGRRKLRNFTPASNERFGWQVSFAAAECHTRLLEVARRFGIAEEDGWVRLPELGALATAIGCSRTALKGYLAELHDAGLVKTDRPSRRAPLRYKIVQPAAAVQEAEGDTASRSDSDPLSRSRPDPPASRVRGEEKSQVKSDDFVVVDEDDDEVLEGEVLNDDHELARLLEGIGPHTIRQRQEWARAHRESPAGFEYVVDHELGKARNRAALLTTLIRAGAHRLTDEEARLLDQSRGLTPSEIETYGIAWGPGTPYETLAAARRGSA
jgi:hypothetical protein